jgi:16S rRNA (cytidine1402-2'-O)-methyltransferase
MSDEPTKKISSEQETNSAPALRSGLYLVSTPIGNLRDISLRAIDTLRAADLIACEDTRVSGKLLKAYDISSKLLSYNDHSDDVRRNEILTAVEGGSVVALISDAGTPMVSDPGFKLVREAQERGLYISSVPGASAPLTALQLSGLPSDCFSFLGFLPSKAVARNNVLEEWAGVNTTLVAFETAPRLLKALADIADVMGGREVAVTRELTKMYEEVRKASAAELIAHYEEQGLPKGEIVLVISPPKEAAYSEQDLEALLKAALKEMRTKDAAADVAKRTGVSKSVLYEMALKL